MRVSIDHTTKTKGLIFKTTHHIVSLTVGFTEEEKAIMKQRDLTGTIVMERDCPSDRDAHSTDPDDLYSLRISDLFAGRAESYALATPLEAKNYEAELTEKLKILKDYIMENRGVEKKSTSFEL